MKYIIEKYKEQFKQMQEFRDYVKKYLGIKKDTFKSWKGLSEFWYEFNLKFELKKETVKDENNKVLKKDENIFFKTDNHEEIFYLLHFKKGYDKELGISKFHYVDKYLAKKWKRDMMKKYHSDIAKSFDLDDEIINSLGQNINKIYKRLVGEA